MDEIQGESEKKLTTYELFYFANADLNDFFWDILWLLSILINNVVKDRKRVEKGHISEKTIWCIQLALLKNYRWKKLSDHFLCKLAKWLWILWLQKIIWTHLGSVKSSSRINYTYFCRVMFFYSHLLLIYLFCFLIQFLKSHTVAETWWESRSPDLYFLLSVWYCI